jgi:hypothetical protein
VWHPWKFGLAATLGILVGVSIQCGGEKKQDAGMCERDSDCALNCATAGACIAKCPCDHASPKWVTSEGWPQLALFTLGSSEPELLSAYGNESVLEWVPRQFAALGVEPTPEPTPLQPTPSKSPKPKPPKPKP